jgi:hypothetical protein
MTDMSNNEPQKTALARYLPLVVIAAVALTGAITLRDYVSFELLRENREALIAFRDSNYLLTVLVFVSIYVGDSGDADRGLPVRNWAGHSV